MILDLGASADIDVTTCDALRELVGTLTHEGVDLLLAQVRGPVRDRLRTAGLMETITEAHVFASVADAVEWWLAQLPPEMTQAGPPAGA